MEKILQQIIETDKNAREKVGVEKKRLAMIEEEILAEKLTIDRHLDEIAEKEIEKAKTEMKIKLENEIKRIDKNFEETENSLQQSYNENRESWINSIFNSVTE